MLRIFMELNFYGEKYETNIWKVHLQFFRSVDFRTKACEVAAFIGASQKCIMFVKMCRPQWQGSD